MNVSVPFVVLCVAGVLLVCALVQAWQTSRPPPPASRKRTRTPAACAQAAGAAAPKQAPWIWSAMKKWDTVRNMMKWKAEMASLDGVIQSIEREAKPKPKPDEKKEPESEPETSSAAL